MESKELFFGCTEEVFEETDETEESEETEEHYAVTMHQRPYEKLIAWKEAFALCLSIYEVTKLFPSEEKFGLVSQIRRASSSVPLNIAEGNAKKSQKEKAHFFETAAASLEEVHCAAKLSYELHFINESEFTKIADHIPRVSFLLTRLRASIL